MHFSFFTTSQQGKTGGHFESNGARRLVVMVMFIPRCQGQRPGKLAGCTVLRNGVILTIQPTTSTGRRAKHVRTRNGDVTGRGGGKFELLLCVVVATNRQKISVKTSLWATNLVTQVRIYGFLWTEMSLDYTRWNIPRILCGVYIRTYNDIVDLLTFYNIH